MSVLSENEKQVFSRRFLILREQMGETQESMASRGRSGFAEAVGDISVASIGRWERGKTAPKAKTIQKIASFINVRECDLYDEKSCSDDRFTIQVRNHLQDRKLKGKNKIIRETTSPGEKVDNGSSVIIAVTCAKKDRKWADWISWTLNAAGYSSTVRVLALKRESSVDGIVEKLDADLIVGLVSGYAIRDRCHHIWEGLHSKSLSSGMGRLLFIEISSLSCPGLPSSIRRAASVDIRELDPQTAVGVTLLGVRQTLGLRSAPPKPSQMNESPPDFPGADHKLHNLKLSQNRNFVGRSSELESLRARLESGLPTALTQAAHGLGGVGKTQLANEYAYRWRDSYQVVWWVRSEDEATLTTDLSDLARALNLPCSTSQQAVECLKQWLIDRDRWLLVFDNVETPDSIRNYLVSSDQGHTIITSRYSAWRGVAESLNVTTFDRQDSIAYLQKRTGQESEEGADDLAAALGDLPLALAQAAAYMEESGLDYEAYLELFQNHQGHLLKVSPPVNEGGYSHTVATTWDISFTKLAETSPAAPELISLLAYFAPDAIPKEIISVAPDVLSESLRNATEDGFPLQEAWRAMHRFSLVEAGPNTVTIHRLVQEVIFQGHSREQQLQYANTALELAVAAISYEENNKETWNKSLPFLPHAIAAANQSLRAKCQEDKAVNLLDNVASIHWKLGQIAEAEDVYRQAMNQGEKHLPDGASILGTVYNNLGTLLRGEDRSDEALPFLEKALDVGLKVLGPDHPTVAIRHGNLGLALRRLGRLVDAEKNFRRALEIDRSHFGENNDAVARDLSNLSRSLSEQQGKDKFEEACDCLRKALEIGKASYPGLHYRLAIRHNNLAMLLRQGGLLDEAEENIRCAIDIDEKYYNLEHPDVAGDLFNLALILMDKSDLDGAEQQLSRALRIFQEKLGASHQSTTECREKLVEVRVMRGNATT
ncbi:MAG: tetratricopeptide repeat protein [Magnetococcales bacterium]|nr:tetratricopeptide repeat protein [Magnetococcales bacterium]